MIPRFFGVICKVGWLAWFLSMAVVLWNNWLSFPLKTRKGVRIILGISWLLAAICVAASFMLPAEIAPSGIMTLTRQEPWDSWKGTAGRALFQLLSVFIGTDYPAAIALLRSFLFLAPPIIVALILRQLVFGSRMETSGSSHPDNSSAFWEAGVGLLPPIIALMLHSAFLDGPLSVRYFGFNPLLTGTFLLSLPLCFSSSGGPAVRVCLVSSLGLMGMSRPEMLLVALALGGMVLFLCWRHRDPALGMAILVLVLLFLWSAEQSYSFVLLDIHREATILGKDMAPSRGILETGLVALKRIGIHIFPNLFFLSWEMNVLGLLALIGIFKGLRRRTLSIEEIACVTVILIEFALVSIKEDGFGGGKYESLIILPAWFLALSTLRPLLVLSWPRQTVSRMMMLGTLLVTILRMIHVLIFPQAYDQNFLYFDAPSIARSLCSKGGATRVLIVGMDERPQTSQPFGESERWPLGTIFCRAGCSTAASYPASIEALGEILSGQMDSSRLSDIPMCATDSGQKREHHPTHLIVTFLRPETRVALGRMLGMPVGRGWRLMKEFSQAAVLEKVLEAPA